MKPGEAASPPSDAFSSPVQRSRPLSGTLGLGALGIVYGDIGTSPLYAFREALRDAPAGEDAVLGLLSLILWSLMLIVSIKYLLIVLRADNHGEGGILALAALLARAGHANDRFGWLIVGFGIAGAALIYGDGAITPAISVMSAVEGLDATGHGLDHLVVPISVVILAALFALQKRGTAGLAALFGPIMLMWFLTLAALGIAGVLESPRVLAALDPRHALAFLWSGGTASFLILGSVFLAVTGAEALYADMGHFGARPIRLAWFALAGPCLVLNYFGQGALVIGDPASFSNPFYGLAPAAGLYPLIALATLATIVASQAMISGVFSLTRQAVQLGFLPRMKIVHTSSSTVGQIYVPFVNAALGAATILLAVGFGASERLAAAYGIAVSTTMVITSLMLFFVMRRCWGIGLLPALAATGCFLAVDLAFFGANLFKLAQGGWLPLVIALTLFVVMTTWRRGRQLLLARMRFDAQSLTDFAHRIEAGPFHRIAGTAIFLSPLQTGAPATMSRLAERMGILHERVIVLTVVTEDVPRVPAARRLTMRRISPGFCRILLHYGFMQTPHVPISLRLAKRAGLDWNLDDATYFIGRVTLVPSEKVPGMALWKERLFALISRNAQTAVRFYDLPPARVVELGLQVEI